MKDDPTQEPIDASAKDAEAIGKALALREQAIRFMEMEELWQDLKIGIENADRKADSTLGEEHQRQVGAKIVLKEWLARVERLAKYQVPGKKKGGQNYA